MGDIYFEAAFGNNRLQRGDGSGDYDYFGQEFSLGVEFHRFPWQGSLTGELGYNHLAGDENVLGSYRHLVFGRIGYRQSFLTYFFASVGAGIGYNQSHINFGEGAIPLLDESNTPLLLSGQIGAQYCFGNRPCVEVFAAPFYETELVGRPDYANLGVLFGAGFRFDLGRTVPYEEYEAVRHERDELRSRPVVGLERSTVEPPSAPSPQQPVDCPDGPPVVASSDPAEILAEDPIRGTVILFSNESPRLPPTSLNPQLEIVVTHLISHPEIGVRIHGHANETGPEELNERLSEQRAEAVAAYLRRHGVSESQIVEVIGHGSAQPLNPERPEDPINRAIRLEEVILP